MSKTNKLPISIIVGLSPQQRLVYDYLTSGRQLSRQVAINTMNIQEVTTRISELGKLGLDIKRQNKKDHNGTRYMAYWVDV